MNHYFFCLITGLKLISYLGITFDMYFNAENNSMMLQKMNVGLQNELKYEIIDHIEWNISRSTNFEDKFPNDNVLVFMFRYFEK